MHVAEVMDKSKQRICELHPRDWKPAINKMTAQMDVTHQSPPGTPTTTNKQMARKVTRDQACKTVPGASCDSNTASPDAVTSN